MSSDPVALAALEALLSDSESESSSVGSNSSASRPGGDAANDNDSDDGVGALDMAIEYEIQYDNDSKNRINDDDDSPTTLKMESNYNDDDSNDSDSSYEYQHYRKRYPLYHLKPFFDVGTSVYAPWWDDRVQKEYCDTFYPGTITSYKEIASSSPYGPLRLYTIVYEDGDHLEDVQDHFVFSKADYLVHHRPLRGVRCEVDGRYADDKWASIVGYYVVTIDGEDMKFASLVGTCAFFSCQSSSVVSVQSDNLCISSIYLLRQMPWTPMISKSFNKWERRMSRSSQRISIDQNAIQSCRKNQQPTKYRGLHRPKRNLDPFFPLDCHHHRRRRHLNPHPHHQRHLLSQRISHPDYSILVVVHPHYQRLN
jgi:hypothetical protein